MKYELLQDFIAQRRQEIFEEGKALANSFYLASEAALSEKSSSRRTKVGTRVRMIGNSLVCEWYWRRLANPGISHKMGRRFLRRGTCTFSSSGTAIYGVSLIHNQLGLDALVDCFKN